jgi:UDP-N-acetylmuramoyl-tripeptide--D-alanyl-D-alanine ligase
MLQASEYNICDYFGWLKRVRDFNAVEKRKQLVKTPKALLLLCLGWIIWIKIVLFALWAALSIPGIYGHILGIAILFTSPSLVAYGIVIPLFAIQLFVQKPIEAITANRARRDLSRHAALKIAIAGSFGKTTMREILKTVLSEGKITAAPAHNYNTPLGISAFVKTLNGNEEVLIFELGEYYPGDVRALCKMIGPDIGIITGVNETHLQKFKTLDRTARTIFELADFLEGKPVYINAESELAAKNARPGHILYSRNGIAEWKVENPKTDLSGTSFVLTNGKEKLHLQSSLLGLHSIGPLALAAVVALNLDLRPEQIQTGTAKTKPFDHRLEPKINQGGIVIIDDSYNGNPDGAKAAIEFLASIQGRRRFYITPGLVEMGAKTETVHKAIGKELASAGIEKVILIKNSVTPYIEQGLKDSGYKGEIIWFNDALKVFSALPHITAAGDIALFQNDWPDQYAPLEILC